MPRSAASETASEVGAPTPTRIGAPATAAFWTSSNDSRPLTHSTWPCSGRRPSSSARPIDLVHRVVAPDVLAHVQQLAVGREEPGGVQAAGAGEAGLAQALGQVGEQRALDRQAGRAAPARGPRPPPARPSRTRRTTTSCRRTARDGSRASGPVDLDGVDREVLGRARRGAARRSALRRRGTRARAPRRGRACASSPRAARRRRGSPAAPRSRPRR